jgi:hypothetical protein
MVERLETCIPFRNQAVRKFDNCNLAILSLRSSKRRSEDYHDVDTHCYRNPVLRINSMEQSSS